MTEYEHLLLELLEGRGRPVLVIDERRFAAAERFAEERVVFAGILTNVGVLTTFGAAIESIRATLDAQKRGRRLKAGDVLSGRLAQPLRSAAAQALGYCSVSFWATSTPYLLRERSQRERPAAYDYINERAINGPETPVIDMMWGQLIEREAWVRQAGRLEVVVDRSQQNGLHHSDAQELGVYEPPLDGAPALRDGRSIRLGAGIPRRVFAACETTPVLGDWLLLADLAAHLWGRSKVAMDRIRGPQLLEGVEEIGTLPGFRLVEELGKTSS